MQTISANHRGSFDSLVSCADGARSNAVRGSFASLRG